MSVLHVYCVGADPVAVNHQVALMCLCCMFMVLMLTPYRQPPGGTDVSVMRVHGVDADLSTVKCQVG